MMFSKLYKIMVNTVTFLGFRGGDRPHPGSAPGIRNMFQFLSFNTTEFLKTSEAAFCCLSKGFQMQRSVLEFYFLKIKGNVSL